MAIRFDVSAPDWTEFEDRRVGTTFDVSSGSRTEFEAVEGTVDTAFPGTTPAGKQDITVGELPWESDDLSLLEGASPAAEEGDIMRVDTHTSGGIAITVNPDGTVEFGQDDDYTEQTFEYELGRASTETWEGPETVTVESYVPTITNGPFTAAPGEQITLQGENLDTVDVRTYAGISVSADAQSATELTFTVPGAFDNGLGFGFTHFIVVDNGAADATTQNTLQAPADAHANGEVSGYDSLGSGEDSWFDDSVISVVDGDYWITFNPNNLTNLTTNADGTSSSDDTGDFTGRVLDTSDNTDGPDGTWTESLTVSISSSGVTINPTVADTFVDAPDPVVTIGSALDPQERTGEQRVTIEVQSGETIVSVGSNSVTPQVGSNTITLQIEDNTVTAE